MFTIITAAEDICLSQDKTDQATLVEAYLFYTDQVLCHDTATGLLDLPTPLLEDHNTQATEPEAQSPVDHRMEVVSAQVAVARIRLERVWVRDGFHRIRLEGER